MSGVLSPLPDSQPSLNMPLLSNEWVNKPDFTEARRDIEGKVLRARTQLLGHHNIALAPQVPAGQSKWESPLRQEDCSELSPARGAISVM